MRLTFARREPTVGPDPCEPRERNVDRKRADLVLVERGLFESRARARAAIEAGLVHADGQRVEKASAGIGAGARIEARAPHPWVSRGGVKLAHGLDAFGIDPAGRVCLDIGASTGGFTQVLLARGAARVTAVDVGRGQLHPSLAGEPRLVMLEGTDARALTRCMLAAPELVTADVSFISLTLTLPVPLALARQGATLVALVKPQFEAGRAALSRGGIVREEADREGACRRVEGFLRDLGWSVLGLVPSPIAGGDGNLEWLIGARRGG